MEDIVEEPIVDIDGCDLKNPLAVVEYVEDLYAYYRRMEGFSCVPPNYLEQQFDINEKMRAILIDWLIEVHDKFELLKETLFLTVNLIDRFLSKQTVVRKKLQLVGLVAMLLACKYEEVSVPVVGDLILISDKAYTRKEVLEMENLMLNTLQFNMSVPTPYVFMKRFLKAAQSDKKLDFKIHDENKSLYNTPPCYGIYMCGLVFEDLLEQGGLGEIEKKNKRKADLLYNAIDESKGFYRCPVEKSVRSLMNVPFTLEKSELEAEFVKEAAKEKMVQLKGHRSVGGMRASIYNAMPLAGVEKLVAFMKDFQAKHA